MTGSLSPAQIQAYSASGYVSPLPAISAAEAASVLSELRAGEATHGPLARVMVDSTHLEFPCLDRLIRDPRVLDAVESLMGADIVCCGAQLFVKEPEAPSFLSWHQDGCYWGPMSREIVTAWVALTESTPENGCVRVLPGSHHTRVPHTETFAPGNMLSHGQAIVEIGTDQAVDLPLKPGEMSLHHSLTVHASNPNLSSQPRVGFSIRYTAGHILQRKSDGGSAVRVRDASCVDA